MLNKQATLHCIKLKPRKPESIKMSAALMEKHIKQLNLIEQIF